MQTDLFHHPANLTEIPSSRERVCQLVAEITQGLSRERVASDMSSLGQRASKSMIDAWASVTREAHNLPFYQVAALELSCDSTLLTDWLVELRGGSASYGEEALRREIATELAALEAERAEFTRRINALRRSIGAS